MKRILTLILLSLSIYAAPPKVTKTVIGGRAILVFARPVEATRICVLTGSAWVADYPDGSVRCSYRCPLSICQVPLDSGVKRVMIWYMKGSVQDVVPYYLYPGGPLIYAQWVGDAFGMPASLDRMILDNTLVSDIPYARRRSTR